jgi:hypothetical protein
MLSRLYPTIYLVQYHKVLLTCPPCDRYDQMHDSIIHSYIHFFHFYFNSIMPFSLSDMWY